MKVASSMAYTRSSKLDPSALDTIGIGSFVKVVAWYDKEWGYSCRTADLIPSPPQGPVSLLSD